MRAEFAGAKTAAPSSQPRPVTITNYAINMTAKTIIMFLPGLSDSDLEVVLARIEKILMWRAEDKLDEFEAPAYSYWARGYPDGPWAMPEGSPERDKWEVRRAFFIRNVERYSPTIREQALSATVRRKWRWPWQTR